MRSATQASRRKPERDQPSGDAAPITTSLAKPLLKAVTRPSRANDVTAASTKRRTPLTHDEVHEIVRRVHSGIKLSSPPIALFYALLATGAKPLELARLTVRDMVAPDGSIRIESTLPAAAAICGVSRPLYLRSQTVRLALADYVRFRVRLQHGTTDSASYHRLDPESMFFLDSSGQAYEIEQTIGQDGARSRGRGMLEACRRIFRLSGIKGLCTNTLRRTLANRLHQRGATEDEIGEVLGIKDRKTVRELLDIPPARTKSVSEMFDEIVPTPERPRDQDT